ncbi:hypothetical protein [Streptomyces sp. OR43]|uniref:hypothetical protein n=1 Tax=Streptomyces sp. or43 TaxID=2478957 RepID=UPI0021CA6957|nr:hypothetical protein [Streptomyces sp. or43]
MQHAIAEGVVLVFQDGPEDEDADGDADEESEATDAGDGGAEPAAEREPVQVLLGLALLDPLAQFALGGQLRLGLGGCRGGGRVPLAAEVRGGVLLGRGPVGLLPGSVGRRLVGTVVAGLRLLGGCGRGGGLVRDDVVVGGRGAGGFPPGKRSHSVLQSWSG